MKHYCGIDLGNKRTAICVISEEREVVWEGEVATETKAIKAALKRFKELQCVVEAAPLAEWLCDLVTELKQKITIVCPRRAKAVLSAQGKKKTDRKDARALAELCKSGWYGQVHRKSSEARELRSYLAARKQLVKNRAAIAASIRGILRANGVKLVAGTDENFSEKVRRAMPRVAKLTQVGLRSLLKAFELLEVEEKRLYRQLDKVAKRGETTALLMTIPGVGPATAAAFVATIDDPNRFATGARVASYIGLVPSVHQSGETEFRGRITKEGDKLLRWLLIEAAHVLLTRTRKGCPLKSWGLQLQAAKGPGKARVAVARKLSCLMWQLWRTNTEFKPYTGLATA